MSQTASAPAAKRPSAARCDRACLIGLTDGYLAALVAKDPSKAPVTKTTRFTENTNPMKLGDGLWGTIGSLGAFKLYVADAKTGQIAFYGTAKENGETALLGLRLKAQGRRISEVEQLVVRKATGIHGTFDTLTQPDPVWDEPIPRAERLPRAAMIKAVDLYFEGIEQGNGDIVPFDAEAFRVENGRVTAPIAATADRPAMSAQAQMSTKTFNYIPHVTQRRYLAIDEERGLVFGTFMFQHPGNIPRPGNASGVPRTATTVDLSSFPNTTEIIEVFKLRKGKLHRIFAYVSLLPYRQGPGWP
ncbi:MAG: hypothetical protein ABIO39_05965 [Caulobacteraceae bacterium]